MQLSEAIRLGAMNRTQCKAAIFEPAQNATCALGAALDAVGVILGQYVYSYEGEKEVAQRWPWVLGFVASPATGSRNEVLQVIASLNDKHGWTRERIADWVESLERENEVKQQAPEVVEVAQ